MTAALDLETSPVEGDLSSGLALEPWRARQGTAYISHASVVDDAGNRVSVPRPSREQLINILRSLAGQEVFAHNALFDVAWLIASIEARRTAPVPEVIRNIRWRDTQLLAKWVVNGRKADDMFFSYSLANLIKTFLKGEDGAQEFVAMKSGAPMDPNSPYWAMRGDLDAIWTLRLAQFLYTKLPPECLQGYIIEQRGIPLLANSWLMGIRVIPEKFKQAEAEIEQAIITGCKELGVAESVLSSPTQLGRMLYDQWKLPVINKTPTGAPSADADTIKVLGYMTKDDRLLKLLTVRENLTLRSKYIRTVHDALARTGDGFLYAIPRMFGTTSGRLTYSNETLKGLKVSIAAQQMPRKAKNVRAFLGPAEDGYVFETDAAAQESRIMGIWSGDENIISIFSQNKNFHSFMACKIYGRAYEEFQETYKDGDEATNEQRQYGKLVNLSCNFRIGGAKLAKKAFTEYDTWMEESTGRYLVNMFKETYPGVPKYWRSIVAFAKEHGYTYTLAQRRWKVPKEMLLSSDAWKVEGTVISHPIQGTGAEMYYAATAQLNDMRLMTTLHDGLFWFVESKDEAEHIINTMNSTPYNKLWGVELPIPLIYEESKLGTSFADVK